MADITEEKEVGKSRAIGGIGAALVGSLVPGAALVCTAVGAITGICIGHFAGKNKEHKKHEQASASGHPLPPEEPSLWNQDAILGGLIGLAAARVITFGAVEMLGGAAALTAVGGVAVIATAVTAAMAVGLYLGGRYGKKCAESEYETKTREYMSKMLSHPLVPGITQQLLNGGLGQVTLPEKSFVQDYLQESLQHGGTGLGVSQ